MGIKMSLNTNKEKQIPEEFKDLAKDFAEKGFITTSSDNLINWQPVVSSTSYDDLCFKFVEGLEFRNISPFASKVVTDQATFTDSVIDDSLVIETKQLKRKVNDDPQSVREIVDGTLFLDEKSSAFD